MNESFPRREPNQLNESELNESEYVTVPNGLNESEQRRVPNVLNESNQSSSAMCFERVQKSERRQQM